MGTQHATHVVSLLCRHTSVEVGSVRHEEAIEAVMGEGHADESRVCAIIGRDIVMNESTEMHLADTVAALIIANARNAHEILRIMCYRIDDSLASHTWRFIPSIAIGCLHAAIWCEENSGEYSAEYGNQLPCRLGKMLRRYIERAPADADSAQDFCSPWAIGRFNELLVQYTSMKYADENLRRIAIMLGVTAKARLQVADCAGPIIRQLSHRALTFLPPGSQLTAVNAELNADRVFD